LFHHETFVADASVKLLPRKDQSSAGILAEGWTVAVPCDPGIEKWTATVWLWPALMSTGTAKSQTGPSAPQATGVPEAPVASKSREASAGRFTARNPMYSP
jgi:hypothetical protein